MENYWRWPACGWATRTSPLNLGASQRRSSALWFGATTRTTGYPHELLAVACLRVGNPDESLELGGQPAAVFSPLVWGYDPNDRISTWSLRTT